MSQGFQAIHGARPQSLEIVPASRSVPSEESPSADDNLGSGCREEAVIDVSAKTWEVALFQRSPKPSEVLYVYKNSFYLMPRAIGRLGRLKTLKFFANEVEVLPPEAGDLAELESLQVKVSAPGVAGFSLQKLKSLRELELCRELPRPSTFSVLSDISALKCLRKLSVCHFSIRYLPPEIGCLKELEELDLSFNKLKNLPDDIAELTELKLLRVANNKLVDLPAGISFLRRLESLDLSNNRLTSLTSLNLSSMHSLQYLNIQFNKQLHCCDIPSWICCEDNNAKKSDEDDFAEEVDVYDLTTNTTHENLSCNGFHGSSLSSFSDIMLRSRCSATQRMRKGWKRRDCLQQKARQERLNYSRNWRGENDNVGKIVNMVEEHDSCKLYGVDGGHPELEFHADEESISDGAESCLQSDHISSKHSTAKEGRALVSLDFIENKKGDSVGDDCSCVIVESSSLDKGYDLDIERQDNCSLLVPLYELNVPDESSSKSSTFFSKSKRHSDKDLDNPKPSKFRRPVDECSEISCKYSSESFCSADDHIPDGFYDAGRDRRFMSLQDYEQSLCLDSREVILLDRKKDEELDAIAFTAQILLSNLTRWSPTVKEEGIADNLQRASLLALFVSDCFGGSDRSNMVLRTRKAVAGLNKQQPFVCTCSMRSLSKMEASKQTYGTNGNADFSDICDKSLRLIKESENSNIVPIGSLRFGVCRHRAVLMKYLCDRANPPIPCELVRGYLDFRPHAWNVIPVRKGNTCVRMVVDACYPTDIREDSDPEYFARYMPLSRVHVPLTAEKSAIVGCSFPSLSLNLETDKAEAQSVFRCKFGTLDAAVKVRTLQAAEASDEELRNFEYAFLGEVRMLGALRNNRYIVEIYGHQLSSKWVETAVRTEEVRLLQSMIVMQYIKGGSLKGYLEKLLKEGVKLVPALMALHIARDVACALVGVHSKHIIHRDVKSENILIDLDSKTDDGAPLVKLSDFDRSVPKSSSLHTCCIAHLGIHPPDVCVGTPRWMAPEVVQAMHQRKLYGLEVDIWSYGCLLLELLTLKIPYEGKTELELYDLLQTKQRPWLTPELEEALVLLDEPNTRSDLGLSTDVEAEIVKLLVDLFYECTKANPEDRPTASHIYEKLCAIQKQPEGTQESRSNA